MTSLHVASHYDHPTIALLLLEKKASPHAAAKNGYTPLHIAAKKNQLDIATSLLEYGAKANAESKAGQCSATHVLRSIFVLISFSASLTRILLRRWLHLQVSRHSIWQLKRAMRIWLAC